MRTVIDINDLKISYKTRTGMVPVIKGVTFSLHENEILALVGGSGCGKTTICKAISGLLGDEAVIEGDISKNTDGAVAFVFQDPYLSLDPSQAVGKQIEEAVLIHAKNNDRVGRSTRKKYARAKALELLSLVGIKDPEERYDHIPLSFSGGMRQRIAIAIALAMEPKIIIADELTSSLDEVNREQIMELLDSLRDKFGTSVILVTHDLGLVENHSDRVLIMEDGLVVEEGKTQMIFSDPQDEYTKSLLRYSRYAKGTEHTHGDLHFHDGKPHSHEHKYDENNISVHDHEKVDATVAHDERLGHVPHLMEIANLSKSYTMARHRKIDVLDKINFNIHKGEVLGLSGKSGIGKTTLAKCIVGLERPDSGTIQYSNELKEKNAIQMIFQDSKSSLNPRMTVKELINEAIRLSKANANTNNKAKAVMAPRLEDLLEMTELDTALLPKRPYEISGGQRQRVAIARALAMEPKFLIADEPISSLDMAAQAQMIHLIKKIQKENHLTVLLISHDMPMLMHVCDRIISLDHN